MGPASCEVTGKVIYVTKSKAVLVCKKMHRRNKLARSKTAPCEPYRCEWCQQFHVGHTDFRKARK